MAFAQKNRGVRTSVIMLFLMAAALGTFIFYVVATNQKFFAQKYSLYMFLPNVEGLLPGAFITLAGMKVGVVGDMVITDHDGDSGIKIDLQIDTDFQNRITASSVATVKTLGVLGDKYIDISLGEPGQTVLRENSWIRSAGGLDATALFEDAAETVTELKAVLKDAAVLTKTAREDGLIGAFLADRQAGKAFSQIVYRLRGAVEGMAAGRGTMGKLLADTALYAVMSNSAGDLQEILGNIRAGRGTLGKLATDTTVYQRITSISTQTDSLLYHLQHRGTTARLLKDPLLYENVVRLSASLDTLSRDMKENPGRYVKLSLF